MYMVFNPSIFGKETQGKKKTKKTKQTRSVCALRCTLTGSLTLILYYQGYKAALHMENNSIC